MRRCSRCWSSRASSCRNRSRMGSTSWSAACHTAWAPPGLVGSDIIGDAKSGVSGAGRSPSIGVHFSEANESLGAYAIEGHRHLPEVTQELSALGRDGVHVTFVPHLAPMTRGILATCY